MEAYERAQIESLAERNQELRRLWAEHQDFETQLAALDAFPHLTSEQELERKQVQKLKLAGKDRIAAIVARDRSRA